jgi:hypothetical protein
MRAKPTLFVALNRRNMRAPTEREPRNDESLIPTVVPVAADDHRRRELDGMEIEREIGELRRKGSCRVQSFFFKDKLLRSITAGKAYSSQHPDQLGPQAAPLPLHARTLILLFSEYVLPKLRLQYGGASPLVAVT